MLARRVRQEDSVATKLQVTGLRRDFAGALGGAGDVHVPHEPAAVDVISCGGGREGVSVQSLRRRTSPSHRLPSRGVLGPHWV